MSYQMLMLARKLETEGISAEVLHVPTIKPLDTQTILASVRKTGRIVTAEEAQIAGGFGGAVAELLAEQSPAPLKRIGMHDRFGESGAPAELLDHFNLTSDKMLPEVAAWVRTVPQYKPAYSGTTCVLMCDLLPFVVISARTGSTPLVELKIRLLDSAGIMASRVALRIPYRASCSPNHFQSRFSFGLVILSTFLL
jgi:hypothetical protein